MLRNTETAKLATLGDTIPTDSKRSGSKLQRRKVVSGNSTARDAMHSVDDILCHRLGKNREHTDLSWCRPLCGQRKLASVVVFFSFMRIFPPFPAILRPPAGLLVPHPRLNTPGGLIFFELGLVGFCCLPLRVAPLSHTSVPLSLACPPLYPPCGLVFLQRFLVAGVPADSGTTCRVTAAFSSSTTPQLHLPLNAPGCLILFQCHSACAMSLIFCLVVGSC